ncbi:MAG: homoserine dehydrogenase [Deltaproteobacteria bacterium]|nr:homoserine dehydrogenase [Deltaproteobacteria bacterium]
MSEISIGLLGLGNVGSGVLHILRSHGAEIEARLGARPVIRKVLVRDAQRPRELELEGLELTTDLAAVLDDPRIQIVVEVMGGTDTAREAVLGALSRGKHVVTANKTLLAHHGDEIFALAREKALDVFYEAAVGGGLPVIRTLREGLASDRLEGITAILNGTTNYILDRMWNEDCALEEAIAGAQAAGYAEADPSSDVEGRDAAEKLALLAAIGFGVRVHPGDIPTVGITGIARADVQEARERRQMVKLLATATRGEDGRLALAVRPTLVPVRSPLAAVRGADNAVMLQAQALGSSLLVGAGAGSLPTGSAVVSDLVECARNLRLGTAGRVPARSVRDTEMQEARLLPPGEHRAAAYLHFEVEDRPGVLGSLATALGDAGVSLSAVEQSRHSPGDPRPVPVVVITHPCLEGDLARAISAIAALPFLAAPPRRLWILPEDEG